MSRELMVLEQENSTKEIIVIEGVFPLAIEVRNQMEITNKQKEDMDGEDLEDNIEKANIKGNLSPKQIEIMRVNYGKQKKEGKNVNASTMQESYLKIKIKMNTLIWNIRLVNTQKVFTGLITLNKRH